MSRRESDNENWGGARSGAGRPKVSTVDKEGKGHVAFKFDMWIFLMPIKRLTESTGMVVRDGKEVPVVYVEKLKMWHEFGCTSSRVHEMYGTLMANLIVDESGFPLTEEAKTRVYASSGGKAGMTDPYAPEPGYGPSWKSR